jgi:hypothetical protein
MAKPRLEEMRIRPAKNGGHNVRHEFAPKPTLSKGALTGGMGLNVPPPEEHNFGPGDGKQLMNHIATALALKGLTGGGQPGNTGDNEGALPAGD